MYPEGGSGSAGFLSSRLSMCSMAQEQLISSRVSKALAGSSRMMSSFKTLKYKVQTGKGIYICKARFRLLHLI